MAGKANAGRATEEYLVLLGEGLDYTQDTKMIVAKPCTTTDTYHVHHLQVYTPVHEALHCCAGKLFSVHSGETLNDRHRIIFFFFMKCALASILRIYCRFV
eukprot:scpid58397/ scgid27460/ 